MSDSPQAKCQRCDCNLEFIAYHKIHIDPISVGQILNTGVKADIYKCPKCGHLEFFESDTGLDMRQREPSDGKDFDYGGF